MRKSWSEGAWEDYLYWQQQDKKILKRMQMNPMNLQKKNDITDTNIAGSIISRQFIFSMLFLTVQLLL